MKTKKKKMKLNPSTRSVLQILHDEKKEKRENKI
jgi:hypothetical protein